MATTSDAARVDDFAGRIDPEDREQSQLLKEMQSQLKKMQATKNNEDPRLSFSTPEFKEAQRIFTDNFKKNFNRPVEWVLAREHPWSVPQLRRLETPVDVTGKPWSDK